MIPKNLCLFVSYFLIHRYSISAVVQTKASATSNGKLEWVMCAVMETGCDLSISVMFLLPWWRHQMETSSALLALCEGNWPVNSPHKGQWCRALLFSLICTWTNGWVNNRGAGDLGRHRAHYNVTVMHASCNASNILQITFSNEFAELKTTALC